MRLTTLLLIGGFIAAVTLLTLFAYGRLVTAQSPAGQRRVAVHMRNVSPVIVVPAQLEGSR